MSVNQIIIYKIYLYRHALMILQTAKLLILSCLSDFMTGSDHFNI